MRQASVLVLALALLAPRVAAKDELEPAFQELYHAIDKKHVPSLLDLAAWSREQGMVREMIHAARKALEQDPDNESARRFLYQKRDGDAWICSLPKPTIAADVAPVDTSAARERKLHEARSRVFKKKQATYFTLWSDLDRDRSVEYAKVMNRFYEETKGYFGSSKGNVGVPVFIFSKRSDYLDFYKLFTGKSGEHVGGFYASTDTGGFLCFYDNVYDPERTFNTARHECTHLLVDQAMKDAELVNWLNEGFAVYLAGSGQDWVGEYPADCYLTVRRLFRAGTALSLDELMDVEYKDFKFAHYAMAWSWVKLLTSDKDRKRKLSRMFQDVRELVDDEKTQKWTAKDWSKETQKLFRENVGSPVRLQQEWDTYVEGDLAPRSHAQKFACARSALEIASGRVPVVPPASTSDRIEMLREAQQWLREASSTEDAALFARIRLEEIGAKLTRATVSDYDEIALTCVAAETALDLDEFLSSESHASLASDASRIALRSLRAVAKAGGYLESRDSIEDFDAVIDARRGTLPNTSDAEWLALLELQRATVSNLIDITKHGCRKALERDPGDAQAAFQWTLLSLEFDKSEAEAVFPHMLLQVELDADDFGLAALAAVYSLMGQEAYAKSLLDRAYSITNDKKSLAVFADHVKSP